ncbi:MAG: hypothetical protein ACTHM6_16910 [Tepidisphaeraceae bacterium]
MAHAMEATPLDSDAMLKLLSDALRRGPGSPEWREAVTQVGQANGPGADEYRLLLKARERLESGREYRQVRAGPAFTRSVFENLDQSPADGRRAPKPAVLIGMLCLVIILVAGGALLMNLLQPRPDAELGKLQAQLFSTPQARWVFDQDIPSELHTAGSLKLISRDGLLRVAGAPDKLPAEARIESTTPIDLAAGACVESLILYQPGETSLAVGVSDTPEMTATSAGKQIAVVLDSSGFRCITPGGSTAPKPLSGGLHTVRIKFLGSVATAEIDGRVIWADGRPIGSQGYPSLTWTRFGKSQNEAAVRSLSVLVP